jgi:hypothetical protein
LTQLLVNMSQEEDLDNASPWRLLDMICLPSPGRFHVKFDSTRIPEADDLRSFQSPSVLAATADEQGLRFITREAYPLALIANDASIKYFYWIEWTNTSGLRFEQNVNFSAFVLHLDLDPSQW